MQSMPMNHDHSHEIRSNMYFDTKIFPVASVGCVDLYQGRVTHTYVAIPSLARFADSVWDASRDCNVVRL